MIVIMVKEEHQFFLHPYFGVMLLLALTNVLICTATRGTCNRNMTIIDTGNWMINAVVFLVGTVFSIVLCKSKWLQLPCSRTAKPVRKL